MASFCISVYFPFRYHTFLVNPETLYADLIKAVFKHFSIDSNYENMFLFQIFDTRYKLYTEFDDGYINQLRKRLPRTSIENLFARIVCRQQIYLLSRQSLSSIRRKHTFPNHVMSPVSNTNTFSTPPYIIVWLDEHFARPRNFRSMKRNLFTATLLEGPICDSFWQDIDVENLIRDDYEVDFDSLNFDGHLKMFTDVDQCRDCIDSQQNNLILLITSDENGRKILPSIYDRILNTYILRDNWDDFEWGLDYIESLQMFDDDLCMLRRLIRDLARHLVDEASQMPPEEAVNYLTWARKLYIQANQRSTYRPSPFTSTALNYIDHQLVYLEAILKTSNEDYEDE